MEPGALGNESTYLDVSVGPYELALQANVVLAVQYEVRFQNPLELRGRKLPLVDLAATFVGTRREQLPFVVAIEVGGVAAAVGVDRVGHLERVTAPRLSAVPAFGLAEPELFEGALRAGGRLVLVLRPAGLVALATR
jgi:hypothetical protein